ncbi:hypothetical protein AXX17_AT4G19970 [Arabidopsis thaliana]|uniref:Uncharacterized protein n=1 Tax=Arabidopsis thaliana TaxID=3702 RepID=A0A178V1Y6_ARATH|nr:hypothetical protein AXX17_AT4G19970 [Arabidopsis thaliana]
MRNLQYLEFGHQSNIDLPQGLVYLPLKLRFLKWYGCPLKSLPSTFKAEYLVKLIMKNSKLEKLWEGTLPLGSLKQMHLHGSKYLKEIPDLSLAINLEELDLVGCKSLVTLPSSIQNATKLIYLDMSDCKKLESFPTDLNLESLVDLNLIGCPNLRNSPAIKRMRCMPCEFHPEYLAFLDVSGYKLEKLWESIQVKVSFNGTQYQKSFFEDAQLQFCKTDHLFFCSFKFQPEDLPSKLTFNDVEFKFYCPNRIKECGVRLMYVSQETEYNQQTTRSEKRMRMTSGTSEEYINLVGDQIVADTLNLATLNLELSLGQGEASSSSSLEGEALCVDYMITEEQDKGVPILSPVSGN